MKAVENGWVSERLTPGLGAAIRVPVFPAQDSHGNGMLMMEKARHSEDLMDLSALRY